MAAALAGAAWVRMGSEGMFDEVPDVTYVVKSDVTHGVVKYGNMLT
jgi:hypothetical protein